MDVKVGQILPNVEPSMPNLTILSTIFPVSEEDYWAEQLTSNDFYAITSKQNSVRSNKPRRYKISRRRYTRQSAEQLKVLQERRLYRYFKAQAKERGRNTADGIYTGEFDWMSPIENVS